MINVNRDLNTKMKEYGYIYSLIYIRTILVNGFFYCYFNYVVESTYYVTLKFPDVAIDDEGNTGFWTLIYNQV